MFFFIALAIFIAGTIPLINTLRKADTMDQGRFRRSLRVSIAVLVGTIVFIIGNNVYFLVYTRFLWFDNLGYAPRYTRVLLTRVILYFAGSAVAFVLLFANLKFTFKRISIKAARYAALPLALGLGLLIGIGVSSRWSEVLLFINQAPSRVTDPVFGRSMSFYLFSLPLYGAVVGWLLLLLFVTLAVVGATWFIALQATEGPLGREERDRGLIRQLLILAGLPLLVLGFNAWLNLFRLMYSDWGVVFGAGYVDVNWRIPAKIVGSVVFGGTGALFLVAAFSRKIRNKLLGFRPQADTLVLVPTAKSLIVPAVGAGLLIIAAGVLPGGIQGLVVDPNEITLEQSYLERNIRFTRTGYGVDDERIDFRQRSAGTSITMQVADMNRKTLDNVRLWDPRALLDNLSQQQEIRLYYQFFDVDVDRYTINGERTQMMLSVRELNKDELAEASQTWVNRHMVYTHGYGLVMLPVHEFQPNGLPILLVRNIPPQTTVPELEVQRPEIYFGELTRDHVYVHTSQPEFDYPAAEENVYTSYRGQGGVPIGNPWRRLAYAWKFDGYRLLFSTYIIPETRLMFHRLITDRASMLAPFLAQDRDPYAVLTPEGRIKYIIDTYTVSSDYPYSQRYFGMLERYHGLNYMRNAVKVVIDAYDGTVDLYIADPDDILIQTWSKVFPGLFKPLEEMPEGLREHIRYPEDLLTVQAELYRTYHMTDVEVFYQREDVWEFATERYRENFQMVEPYYAMVHLPETEGVEFILIIPFTPENKNVLHAWMSGRSDLPHYGEVVVYALPKGVEILGPRQIEARIDQNDQMSRTLSLWDQRGSQVIRGNMLAIPLMGPEELFILYAEPIFLQAEQAQLPEIRRVILADHNQVVWAETFPQALEALIGVREEPEEAAVTRAEPGAPEAAAAVPAAYRELVQSAVQAFESYRNNLAAGDYVEAGRNLEQLQGAMRDLSERMDGGTGAGTGE
jgi:hypothetical protein